MKESRAQSLRALLKAAAADSTGSLMSARLCNKGDNKEIHYPREQTSWRHRERGSGDSGKHLHAAVRNARGRILIHGGAAVPTP